jgi:hypothetical protein
MGTGLACRYPMAQTVQFVPRISTNTQDATVSFPITSASAFYIVGHLDLDHGPYHVTVTPLVDIHPPQTTYYNGSSRWIALDVIKNLTTDLDRAQAYNVDIVIDAPQYFDMSQIVILDSPLCVWPPLYSIHALSVDRVYLVPHLYHHKVPVSIPLLGALLQD